MNGRPSYQLIPQQVEPVAYRVDFGRGAPFPFKLIDPTSVRLADRGRMGPPWPPLTPWPPIPAGAGGFLRSIEIQITGYGPARPAPRPRAAADRTRSRRAAAGSRRTRRHGPRSRGPSGAPAPDWPFNAITGRDVYAANR